MKFRMLLSSAAVATAMMVTSGDALAQKGSMLEPESGWAVTSIDGDGTPGGAYCAMARRFSGGMILTVARNEKSETSLAIDFAQGNFNVREPLSVALDPGAGQQRNYEIKPVSKKAFVVRLGGDDEFFGALERTGFLRVEAGDKFFNFNLADIDKGQSQLESCVVNLTAPAAGDVAGMTPMPGEGGEYGGTVYQAELRALRQEIEALRQENVRIASTLGVPAPASAPQGVIGGAALTPVAAERIAEGKISAPPAFPGAGASPNSTVDQATLLRRISVLEEENRRLSSATGAGGIVEENRRLQLALNECSSISPGTQFVTGQAAEVFGAHIAQLREENTRLTQQITAMRNLAAQNVMPEIQKQTAVQEPVVLDKEAMIQDVPPQKVAAADIPAPVPAPTPKRKPEVPAKVQMYGILREDDLSAAPEEKAADNAANRMESGVIAAAFAEAVGEPYKAPAPKKQNVEDMVRESAASIEDALRAAGITPKGPVSITAQPGSLNGAAVYQWESAGLSGTAERRVTRGAGSFDDAVQEYIDGFRARCGSGDFAFVPAEDRALRDMRIATYDVACVGAGVDKSAALLFIEKGGVLTVFAHEAAAEKLAGAMDARDALAQVISSQSGLI